VPPAPEAPQTPAAPQENAAPPVIRLAAADKVLFVGDSMMQSIAPLLQRTLLREGGIRSINLSRHSTGLTNAAYFNWPQAVEAALRQHPDTRLVVVFLGANDPWDFFESRSRKRFGTPEWDEAYAARALRITRAARQAGASVIWIGLPLMRANDYGQRIRRLNAVLAQNLDAAALWLPTEELLGDGTPSYADSIRLEGKLTRVRHVDGEQKAISERTADGVAFSRKVLIDAAQHIAEHGGNATFRLREPNEIPAGGRGQPLRWPPAGLMVPARMSSLLCSSGRWGKPPGSKPCPG